MLWSCYSPDIICLTETWLFDDIGDMELCIDSYWLARLKRVGGIAIYYVENFLSFAVIHFVPELEFLALSFVDNVLLAVAYRPPSSIT